MKKTNLVTRSQELYAEACKVLPGGVSRNTIYRKPYPDYVERGQGCYVIDVQGIKRVDFANNMCSLIHGHAHPAIIEAVSQQMQRGTAFTMATEAELRFAQYLCDRTPSFDKIRFMNSGTEAVMAAIKTARAVTGRPKIAKTEGAYHGTYDYAEVSQKVSPENWGDKQRPNRIPVVRGTPQGALDDVVVIPFNDTQNSLALLDRHVKDLACVIIDPLPHRIGLIPGTDEFVNALRQWTSENKVLLVFDEVITYRMSYSGAQQWYGINPDLTAMGKIIGGGFPVGALAGRADFMSVLDPTHEPIPYPHSGTFSANPITMTAGLVAMQLYDRAAVKRLNDLGDLARRRVKEAIVRTGIKACVTGAGSMFRVHFKEHPPVEYRSAYQDVDEAARVKSLVDYLYDHGFMMINTCTAALSTPMTENEIEQLAQAIEAGFKRGQATY